MSYSINGTVVINSSGQIDWSKIINVPTIITGATTYRSVTANTANTSNAYEIGKQYRLELTGTNVRVLRVITLGDCTSVCDCNCNNSGGAG